MERKRLIETLGKNDLEENRKKELYKKLEDNNAYFEDFTDEKRTEIGKLFESADDSYARTAEWQNFYMAFISTASLSTYKTVDKFNDAFKDLKQRKKAIDDEMVRVNQKIAEAKQIAPDLKTKNVEEKLVEYKKEQNLLKNKYEQEKQESDEKKNKLINNYIKYRSSKKDYEDAVKSQGDFAKLEAAMKSDDEYIKYEPSEKVDKLIDEQKRILENIEEEKTEALKNASSDLKNYLNETYTKKEKERLDVLNAFKNDLNFFMSNNKEKIKETYSVEIDPVNESTGIYQILFDIRKNIKLKTYKNDREKMPKIVATNTKALKNVDVLAEILSEHRQGYMDKAACVDVVKNYSVKEALEVINYAISNINKSLDGRKTEMFKKLTDNDKNFFAPFEEKEKATNSKIEKYEKIKNYIARRTEESYNRDYNQFINRKIKEGKYYINCISEKELGTVNGDEYLKKKKEEKENVIRQSKEDIDKYKNDHDELEKEVARFKVIEEEYFKNKNLYNKKIDIANKLMNMEENFNIPRYRQVAKEKCKNAPKLEYDEVMKKKQVAGQALLKRAKAYAGSHKNSVEFTKMITAMTHVTNWGTKDAIESPDAPKTYEEAVTQLKDNIEKYVKAKKGQKRLFPTKLRYLRFQLAKALDEYAEEQKENLKDITISKEEADRWNMFFENNGEITISDEKDKVPETGGKQREEKNKKELEVDAHELWEKQNSMSLG